MTRARLALLLSVLASATPHGHQLDEYLQATRLDVSHDRIAVELTLTPGMAVAADVIEMIDADRNGRAEPGEVERYARQVIGDLSLRVDDRHVPLALTRAESPTWDEIRDGMGRIRLEAEARPGLTRAGRHHIVYENAHRADSGVYLVNALKPSTADIVISGQTRDPLQHRLELDVEIVGAGERAIWIVLASSVLAAAVFARRRWNVRAL